MTITESPDCIRVTQRWFSNGASLEHFQQMCSSLERFPILLSSSTFFQIYDIIIDFISNVKHLFSASLQVSSLALVLDIHSFLNWKCPKMKKKLLFISIFGDNTIFFILNVHFPSLFSVSLIEFGHIELIIYIISKKLMPFLQIVEF